METSKKEDKKKDPKNDPKNSSNEVGSLKTGNHPDPSKEEK